MNQVVTLTEYISTPHLKTVLVGGCFDIIHIGHVRFLEAARKHGDELIVALESDEFIRQFKKREPFHSQSERAEILSALKSVDKVVVLPLLTSAEEYANLVGTIKPTVIAITENDSQEQNKRDHAKRFGAEVVAVIPLIPQKSTSDILKTEPSKKID